MYCPRQAANVRRPQTSPRQAASSGRSGAEGLGRHPARPSDKCAAVGEGRVEGAAGWARSQRMVLRPPAHASIAEKKPGSRRAGDRASLATFGGGQPTLRLTTNLGHFSNARPAASSNSRPAAVLKSLPLPTAITLAFSLSLPLAPGLLTRRSPWRCLRGPARYAQAGHRRQALATPWELWTCALTSMRRCLARSCSPSVPLPHFA